ncbi:hypothetical protein SFR_4441 [Streptomyces sp. FR-008]|nr:hypothetical protein SFR_4441 [Streptomyces sp. FR-008]
MPRPPGEILANHGDPATVGGATGERRWWDGTEAQGRAPS